MSYSIVIFLVAVLLSFSAVSLIKYIGHKYNILLYPQEDRWHSRPIAIHGGLGFFPVFILLIFFTIGMSSEMINIFNSSLQNELMIENFFADLAFLIGLIGSSIILFILGWMDDIFRFSAKLKFGVQLIVSSVFILDFGTFPITQIESINFFYTLFWFIGIINATNLIDCMDGLCSGVIIISSSYLLFILLQTNMADTETFLSMNLIILFIGSLAGFLVLNFPPAKIFMGDSGSLPIGFIIAAMTMPSDFNTFAISQDISQQVLIPIALLLYPIFDTSLVFISRTLNKRKFYHGGKDHSCHRLVGLGLTEQQSILICYTFGLLGGLVAVLIHLFPGFILFFILALVSIFLPPLVYLHNIHEYDIASSLSAED